MKDLVFAKPDPKESSDLIRASAAKPHSINNLVRMARFELARSFEPNVLSVGRLPIPSHAHKILVPTLGFEPRNNYF